jgi:hypothetical protein
MLKVKCTQRGETHAARDDKAVMTACGKRWFFHASDGAPREFFCPFCQKLLARAARGNARSR